MQRKGGLQYINDKENYYLIQKQFTLNTEMYTRGIVYIIIIRKNC